MTHLATPAILFVMFSVDSLCTSAWTSGQACPLAHAESALTCSVHACWELGGDVLVDPDAVWNWRYPNLGPLPRGFASKTRSMKDHPYGLASPSHWVICGFHCHPSSYVWRPCSSGDRLQSMMSASTQALGTATPKDTGIVSHACTQFKIPCHVCSAYQDDVSHARPVTLPQKVKVILIGFKMFWVPRGIWGLPCPMDTFLVLFHLQFTMF